jgi:hypothetical protein
MQRARASRPDEAKAYLFEITVVFQRNTNRACRELQTNPPWQGDHQSSPRVTRPISPDFRCQTGDLYAGASLPCRQPLLPTGSSLRFAARMASPANNHSTAPAGYSFGYSVASSSTAFRVSELLVAGKLYRPPAGHTMPGRSSGSSRGDSRDLRARTNRAYSNNDVRPNTGRHASRWLIQGPR